MCVHLGAFERHAASDPRSLHANAAHPPEPGAANLTLHVSGATADAPMMDNAGVPPHAKHALEALCCLFHEFTHAAELATVIAAMQRPPAWSFGVNADPSQWAAQTTLGE